jgi:hypothetical protein
MSQRRATQYHMRCEHRSRGRMEALIGQVLHPCRSFPLEGCMTVVQEVHKNSKAGVGNGRAKGPFPSRRDVPECS